jgi:hypothetical protein
VCALSSWTLCDAGGPSAPLLLLLRSGATNPGGGGAPPKRGTLLVFHHPTPLPPPHNDTMNGKKHILCLSTTNWLTKTSYRVSCFVLCGFFFICCVFLTFYSAAAGNLVLSSTLSFLNVIISFALQKILLF